MSNRRWRNIDSPFPAVFARIRFALALAPLTILLGGCAIASAPLKETPQVVATPAAGQLTISSAPHSPIGQVQPVYVSIANGTDVPRSVVPSQIFALNDAGNRVAPLPPGEAARQAGSAGALKAALVSAAASGAIEGALGAGVGAIAGSLIHSGGEGAGIGTAIGGGEGILRGVEAGPAKAESQANQQLTALSLQPGDVRHDFTVSGYVYFPKGDYKELQLLLVDSESGDTEVINRPWK